MAASEGRRDARDERRRDRRPGWPSCARSCSTCGSATRMKQLDNPLKIRESRREMARLLTVLNEKQRAAARPRRRRRHGRGLGRHEESGSTHDDGNDRTQSQEDARRQGGQRPHGQDHRGLHRAPGEARHLRPLRAPPREVQGARREERVPASGTSSASWRRARCRRTSAGGSSSSWSARDSACGTRRRSRAGPEGDA